MNRRRRGEAGWKRFLKEGADRERTGKPQLWERCGARRARYQCGKSPGHSKKHRDAEGGFEWHDERVGLLAEVDALNAKLGDCGPLRLFLPASGDRPRARVWRAYLSDAGVLLLTGEGVDRPLGGPNVEVGDDAWAALLVEAKVPRAATATSRSGV